MTNKGIVKKYVEYLLSRLKKSPDQNDRDLYKYLEKSRGSELKTSAIRFIKDLGEMSELNWRHNINPSKLRCIIRNANRKKNLPGFIRSSVLKNVRI